MIATSWLKVVNNYMIDCDCIGGNNPKWCENMYRQRVLLGASFAIEECRYNGIDLRLSI